MFHTSPFAVMGQSDHKEEVDFEEDHDDIIYHLNNFRANGSILNEKNHLKEYFCWL